MSKVALITGALGQDGSYLAKQLIEDGYRVIGTTSQSNPNTWRYDYLSIVNKVELTQLDFNSISHFDEIITKYKPTHIYNLAAQSSVHESFNKPFETNKINAFSVLYMLDFIRRMAPKTKFYQASSSEMFGNSGIDSSPKNESSEFNPVSPYAVSKLFIHQTLNIYRTAYNIFACSGILFNHESPLRSANFVSKKIISIACNIKKGSNEVLELGNLDAARDWGCAREYVSAMKLIIESNTPEDYVISSGESYSIREFVNITFKLLGYDLQWEGTGLNEIAKCKNTGKILVKISPKFFRPVELKKIVGDSQKAFSQLNWKSTKTFPNIITDMIEFELNNKPI